MDQVDRILAQWAHERADLDVSPMGVIGRLSRLALYVERGLEQNFERFGLTGGTFDVLATLRRAGSPYRLSPTDVFKEMMITSGTMTNRLDRLERAGLVTRLLDPQDRRGVLVELTPQGFELVERALQAHVAYEAQLVRPLSTEEQALLVGLLRKLLEPFENRSKGEESPEVRG